MFQANVSSALMSSIDVAMAWILDETALIKPYQQMSKIL